MHTVLVEVRDWIEGVLAFFPGRVGFLLRRLWFAWFFKRVEGKVSIGRGCTLAGTENMSFGGTVSLGDYCHLAARDGRLNIGANTTLNTNVCLGADMSEIEIGRDVMIAMNVVMRSANHSYDQSPRVPMRKQGHRADRIIISDDVWIGANAVILAGARIGSHCVIGAGAVVSGEIPSNSVALGVPARVVKTLGAASESPSHGT